MVSYSTDENAVRENNYTMVIQSRPHYISGDKSRSGELFRFLAYCNYEDTEGLVFTFYSDSQRYSSTGTYTETHETELADAGQKYFRHILEVILPEGFTGSFFEYKMEKIIPDTGLFNWRGADFKVIHRPELGPEFNSPMGAIATGWS